MMTSLAKCEVAKKAAETVGLCFLTAKPRVAFTMMMTVTVTMTSSDRNRDRDRDHDIE